MKKMTEKTIQDALAGESQAYAKYLIFADVAREEGYPNVAKLFEAIAYAERIHIRNHMEALGDLTNTAEHIKKALGGENFEVEEMYDAFMAVAKHQEEKAAVRTHRLAFEAEKSHAEAFEKALASVESSKDISTEEVYICPTCGYSSESSPPERCPVCKVKGEKFLKF